MAGGEPPHLEGDAFGGSRSPDGIEAVHSPPEHLGNDSGRQPLLTARHEQPEQLEPGFLGKGAECGDGVLLVHRQEFHGSTIIEYMLTAQTASSIFREMSK